MLWAILCLGALVAAVAGCGAKAGATSDPKPHPARHRAPAGPLGSLRLYVDPNSSAALQAASWRRVGQKRNADAVSVIAAQPTAQWLTDGRTPRAIAAAHVTAAARAKAAATLVLYDIPDRDCHGYSSGGAPSPGAYLSFVRQVAAGIGSRTAIVVLEPDALDQSVSGCVASNLVSTRYQLMASAVGILKAKPHTHVYIDAGNASWVPAEQLVEPLKRSGVGHADGFAVNVSNFQSTPESVAYARKLSALVGGAHFVIDTSRNGVGPPPGPQGLSSWCNPTGRALGQRPSTDTGIAKLDAYLWIKYPGDSDGTCNGGPPAGTWWPAYALGLVARAKSIDDALAHPAKLTPTPPAVTTTSSSSAG